MKTLKSIGETVPTVSQAPKQAQVEPEHQTRFMPFNMEK